MVFGNVGAKLGAGYSIYPGCGERSTRTAAEQFAKHTSIIITNVWYVFYAFLCFMKGISRTAYFIPAASFI